MIVIGLDNGTVHYAYIKLNKDKITFSIQKQQTDDSADYITQITSNQTQLFVTSGDGYVYSYDLDNNLELQDISNQHDYELSCIITSGNKIIIGTDSSRLLIYKQNDLSEEVGKIKLEYNCNCMERIQNLLIIGQEDGTIRGYNMNNLQYVGVLAKVMQEGVDIIQINSDESLLFIATRETVNKIYLYSLLFMQDDSIKEKLGLNKKQETDDYKNYIQLIEDEEESESSQLDELFNSQQESSEEQQRQKQKPKGYAKNSKLAQKKEFFNDL